MIERIYLLDGESGYGVFRFWLKQLREAFVAEGVAAEIVGIKEEVELPVSSTTASFGFNLIRAWHPAVISRKHFIWMVDPPPYHGHFFAHQLTGMPVDPTRCCVGCVDAGWAQFAKQMYGYDNILFLPHATSVARDLEPGQKTRDIDAVFLGGIQCPDGLLDQLKARAGQHWPLFEEFISMLTAHRESVCLHEGMGRLVQQLGLPQDKAQVFINVYYPLIDRYLRNRDRLDMIQAVEGISLQVYGAGDWSAVDLPNHVKVCEAVEFDALADVLSRARVVINHSPTHREGLHERILDALMCGAAVLTTASSCVEQCFGTDCGVVPYSAETVSTTLMESLADDRCCEKIAKGKKTVAREHTLRHRVRKILQALNDLD